MGCGPSYAIPTLYGVVKTMRAIDPDNPHVQDESLRLMKMYIWAAIGVAVLLALVVAGGSAMAHFGSQSASPTTSSTNASQ